MSQPSEEAIRDRAYAIWEREGRPQGRERDHWLQAAWELSGEAAKAAAASEPAKPAKPSPRGGKGVGRRSKPSE